MSGRSRVRWNWRGAIAKAKAKAKWIFDRLRSKGIRYWATAGVILVVAVTGSPYVYSYLGLTEHRARFFQWLLERGPRPPEPGFVRLVLIDDDEYWQGPLAGRRPIKRDYLAHLVDRLVEANAHVIALDFDVRLQDPQRLEIPADYRDETKKLIDAIRRAAGKEKKIVLGTSLSYDANGDYQRDPDIYTVSGLCGGRSQSTEAQTEDAVARNVTCGYIILPYDRLVVPGQQQLADGSILDSFGLAVARAVEPASIERRLAQIGPGIGYGNFISEDQFREWRYLFSASFLRKATTAQLVDQLQAKAVIVGARWSQFAAGRGQRIDLHATPIGPMVGALLHANYAAALLDRRTVAVVSPGFLSGIEIIFSVTAALMFALVSRLLTKIAAFMAFVVGLLFIQWVMLRESAVFFDAFVPLLGLGVHAVCERLAGLHEQRRRRTPRPRTDAALP